MTHYWTQTMGMFRPSFASDEKHGTVIITEDDNEDLIAHILADHIERSNTRRTVQDDYRIEDYSDEIRIYVQGYDNRTGRPNRWRTLINLQYEGES